MTTQNTTQATGTKQYTNLVTKKRGFLAHDAKYFDRTCATCGGMYLSAATSNCPKCGQPLTFLKIKGGRAMSVTECTLFPMLRKDDIERLKGRETKDPSFLPITYRFKMFSFSNDGVLTPPPELMRLKKGAMVEFMCFNTPEYASGYFSEKLNRNCVELMFLIFKDRGSSVKVISDPKVKADYAIPYQVDAAGNPAPVAPPFPQGAEALQKAIDEMEKTIADMRAVAAAAAAAVAPQQVAVGGDDPMADNSEFVVMDEDYDDMPPF